MVYIGTWKDDVVVCLTRPTRESILWARVKGNNPLIMIKKVFTLTLEDNNKIMRREINFLIKGAFFF